MALPFWSTLSEPEDDPPPADAAASTESHSSLLPKARTAYHTDHAMSATATGAPVRSCTTTKPPMLPVASTSIRIPLRASRYTPQTTDSRPKTRRYVSDAFTEGVEAYQALAKTPASGRRTTA